MEILMKVITFCGGALFLTVATGILTTILFKYYPEIIRKILGE